MTDREEQQVVGDVQGGASSPERPGDGEPTAVRPVRFGQLGEGAERGQPRDNMELILDVPLRVEVELGRVTMTIGQILSLGPGSVIELDKLANEPVDLVVNERLIARGEVVLVDDNLGVRLTDIVSPAKRAVSLG